MIVAGHGRVEAAKQIGMTEVPVRKLAHLSRDEIRAYILADNRLAEMLAGTKIFSPLNCKALLILISILIPWVFRWLRSI